MSLQVAIPVRPCKVALSPTMHAIATCCSGPGIHAWSNLSYKPLPFGANHIICLDLPQSAMLPLIMHIADQKLLPQAGGGVLSGGYCIAAAIGEQADRGRAMSGCMPTVPRGTT